MRLDTGDSIALGCEPVGLVAPQIAFVADRSSVFAGELAAELRARTKKPAEWQASSVAS